MTQSFENDTSAYGFGVRIYWHIYYLIILQICMVKHCLVYTGQGSVSGLLKLSALNEQSTYNTPLQYEITIQLEYNCY